VVVEKGMEHKEREGISFGRTIVVVVSTSQNEVMSNSEAVAPAII